MWRNDDTGSMYVNNGDWYGDSESFEGNLPGYLCRTPLSKTPIAIKKAYGRGCGSYVHMDNARYGKSGGQYSV
jgi:hypothetical protein